MKINKDYMNDFLSRFTYNTNAIEGSTITLPETVSIILYGYVSSKGSIREIYEVENHKLAYESMLNLLEENLSVDVVRDLHAILMDRLHHEAGQFKKNDNAIMGANFDTTRKEFVLHEMKIWCDDLNSYLKECKSIKDIILYISKYHILFERIHPFADGNGRMGRLLINMLLIKSDLKPIVILNEDKLDYYKILADQNEEGLSKLMTELISKEDKREKLFANSSII